MDLSAFLSVMIYICQNTIFTIDFLLQGLQEQLAGGVLAFQPAGIASCSKLGQGFLYIGVRGGQLNCY